MAKAKRRATKGSAVKKTWYPIIAPKMFNEQVVGETLLTEAQSAMGRYVPVNLMSLTGDMKKQSINIMLKINNVSGSKLYTELTGYEMQASSIKRMARRGKNKIDYVFKAVTKDGAKVNIKAIMSTMNETTISTLNSLRIKCKENVRKMLAEMNYEDMARDLINHKLQSISKKALSKIYPVKIVEFRSVRLENKGAAPIKEEVKKAPEEKAEESPVEEKTEEVKAEEVEETKK